MASAAVRPIAMVPSRVRLVIVAAFGALVGGLLSLLTRPEAAVLGGWDALCVAYLAWAWLGARRLTPAGTAQWALREDPGRPGFDALMVAASVASLAGVGLVVAASGSMSGIGKELDAGLAAASVVVSWALVHTVYAERYARLYYTEPVGGIDFNDDEPSYVDFAYLSFTIGMTFQVSDTALTRTTIRYAALRHALLSYLFGAVIIAATINLLVGLAK